MLARVWNKQNSYIVGGSVIWYNHFGKIPGTKLTPTLSPSNSTPKYVPKRNGSICPQKDVSASVYSSWFITTVN